MALSSPLQAAWFRKTPARQEPIQGSCMHHVYIVRCADGTLYTGIAKDVARRVDEHNSSSLLAARYTRARRPVVLVYQEMTPTRSTASKREYEIKQMSRLEKEALLLLSARRRKGRRVRI